MLDPHTTVLQSPGPDVFVRVVNAVVPLLAPDVRQQFNLIKLYYLTEYGVAGLYERMNGRTLAQVVAEYAGPSFRVDTTGERTGFGSHSTNPTPPSRLDYS